MTLWRFLRQSLVALSIVGLLVAPVASMAASVMPGPASAMIGGDGVECCPAEDGMPGCPKACPLMSVCMVQCFQSVSEQPPTLFLDSEATDSARCCDDAKRDRLADDPIPRPPTT